VQGALHRPFAEAEPGHVADNDPVAAPDEPNDDTGVGLPRPETVALWLKLIARWGPDELSDFEERTFRQLDLRR